MKKDIFTDRNICRECAEEDNADETTPAAAEDECCSCCCCSCTESESENSSQQHSVIPPTMEEQKRNLLSKLSVVQAGRDPVSIQSVLQFVEAMSHSKDFLRQYNLQDEFCAECALYGGSFDSCASGISNLSLGDTCPAEYCEICNTTDDHERQSTPCRGCSHCALKPGISPSRKQKSDDHRGRRRRRRTMNIRYPNIRRSGQNSSSGLGERQTPQRNSTCGTDCCSSGCTDNRRRVTNCSGCESSCKDNFLGTPESSCEECAREVASPTVDNNNVLRGNGRRLYEREPDDGAFCEECDIGTSNVDECKVPGCEDCKREDSNTGQSYDCSCSGNCKTPIKNSKSCSSEQKPTCPFLEDAPPQQRQNFRKTTKRHSKRRRKCPPKKSSRASEGTSQGTSQGTSRGTNRGASRRANVQSTSKINECCDECEDCSCEECHQNTPVSDESCDECGYHHSKDRGPKNF